MGAGYAVRLRPLTLNNAKPLLPVGGHPMIDYVLGRIDELPQIDRVFVVVNQKFFDHFQAWVKTAPTSKPIALVNDGSTSDENKLGAVGDINFTIEKEGIRDDLLVVGGDNLFDFSLSDFVSFFENKGTSVALCTCGDVASAKRFNSVEMDEDGRIVFFKEKPENPRSDVVAICLYLFEKSSLTLLKKYLNEGGNPDAPGYYIQWLYRQIPVYGKAMPGTWCDIGDKETYQEADHSFGQGFQRSQAERVQKP